MRKKISEILTSLGVMATYAWVNVTSVLADNGNKGGAEGESKAGGTGSYDPADIGSWDDGSLDTVKTEIKGKGGAVFNTMTLIFIIVMVVGLILTAIGMVWWRNSSQKKDEQKTGAVICIAAGLIAFGAPAIVALVQGLFGGN